MNVTDLLKEVEKLKTEVADTTRGANEAWVSRQKLQDTYQKLILTDLEFALDKKLEQELWNQAFKNQINTLQNQSKDKQNAKRGEIQASLNLFLEAASGFYIQLLQEMCCAFNLDLPFRCKSSNIGIIKEYKATSLRISPPKKSSCMYVCQHCLVHLGDIARYRQQIDQAQVYYRHAARLVPYNGHPYNQLAILEAAKGNKLSTIFFYVRSIAVKHPFPVAATNLEKFYTKISKDGHEVRQKLSVSELVNAFLQFQSLIYLCTDVAKTKGHMSKILSNLPLHISTSSVSSYQLVQMISINFYALFHIRRKLGLSVVSDTAKNTAAKSGDKGGLANQENGEGRRESRHSSVNDENVELGDKAGSMEVGGSEGGGLIDGGTSGRPSRNDLQVCQDVALEFTVSFFIVLIQAALRDETKIKQHSAMMSIRLAFDWLCCNLADLSNSYLRNPLLWSSAVKLLNRLQNCLIQSRDPSLETQLQKHAKSPLQEDYDLECFLPINKILMEVDFTSMPQNCLSETVETYLRFRRILSAASIIADESSTSEVLRVDRSQPGVLLFSTTLQQPESTAAAVVSSRSSASPVSKKSTRQNVAMQAFMQRIQRESPAGSASEESRSSYLSDLTNKSDQDSKTSANKIPIDSISRDGFPSLKKSDLEVLAGDPYTELSENGGAGWMNKDFLGLEGLSQSSGGSGMSAASEMNNIGGLFSATPTPGMEAASPPLQNIGNFSFNHSGALPPQTKLNTSWLNQDDQAVGRPRNQLQGQIIGSGLNQFSTGQQYTDTRGINVIGSRPIGSKTNQSAGIPSLGERGFYSHSSIEADHLANYQNSYPSDVIQGGIGSLGKPENATHNANLVQIPSANPWPSTQPFKFEDPAVLNIGSSTSAFSQISSNKEASFAPSVKNSSTNEPPLSCAQLANPSQPGTSSAGSLFGGASSQGNQNFSDIMSEAYASDVMKMIVESSAGVDSRYSQFGGLIQDRSAAYSKASATQPASALNSTQPVGSVVNQWPSGTSSEQDDLWAAFQQQLQQQQQNQHLQELQQKQQQNAQLQELHQQQQIRMLQQQILDDQRLREQKEKQLQAQQLQVQQLQAQQMQAQQLQAQQLHQQQQQAKLQQQAQLMQQQRVQRAQQLHQQQLLTQQQQQEFIFPSTSSSQPHRIFSDPLYGQAQQSATNLSTDANPLSAEQQLVRLLSAASQSGNSEFELNMLLNPNSFDSEKQSNQSARGHMTLEEVERIALGLSARQDQRFPAASTAAEFQPTSSGSIMSNGSIHSANSLLPWQIQQQQNIAQQQQQQQQMLLHQQLKQQQQQEKQHQLQQQYKWQQQQQKKEEEKKKQTVGGSYSLFSQSPWSVGLEQQHKNDNAHEMAGYLSRELVGGGAARGAVRPVSNESGKWSSRSGELLSPWNSVTAVGGPLSPQSNRAVGPIASSVVGPLSPATQQSNRAGADMMANSVQNIWQGGPSPLEKLLEQQKQQRQSDLR